MASPFGGTGRPLGDESDRRRMAFVGLVSSGVAFHEAAEMAHINLRRALRILNEPEMRQVIALQVEREAAA